MNKENKGAEVEDLVERVCKLIFLPDITVRSPKYKKGGKLEKEAADFIVPFDDTLLCFQVKSRSVFTRVPKTIEVDYQRIRKTIQRGIDQLKTIKGAIDQKLFSEFQNSRGLKLPIDCSKFKSLIGIVIVELIGESEFSEEEKTSILNGYTYEHGMPIHIFKLDVFNEISTEIDTIPDFVKYLQTRETFISEGILSPVSEELDFLAYYKTNQNEVEKCLKGEIRMVHLEKGIWKAYQSNRELIDKRDYLNQPSYFIDAVIKEIHTSIGFNPDDELLSNQYNYICNSKETYITTIIELSKLDRIHRRVLGVKFLEKMQEADSQPYSYGCFLPKDNEVKVIVLSSKFPRSERAELLYKYCALYYCGKRLNNIIGIATENFSVNQRSYDVMILADVEFEDQEMIMAQFDEWNPQEKSLTAKEFE